MYFYALESLPNDVEDIDDGVRHMTDKPMKNGRKYMDYSFVHNVIDTKNTDHYFVTARV